MREMKMTEKTISELIDDLDRAFMSFAPQGETLEGIKALVYESTPEAKRTSRATTTYHPTSY